MSGAMLVFGRVGVEEQPAARSQVIGLRAGVATPEFYVEAAAGAEVVQVRIAINSIDDVGAAENLAGPKFGRQLSPDTELPILLNTDLLAVYVLAIQSGANNPAPTAGWIGAANTHEASPAAINVDKLMQRLDGWGAGVRKLLVSLSRPWDSGRRAIVRVEGYR